MEPSSICLHLDNQFIEYEPCGEEPFTPPRTMNTRTKVLNEGENYILSPKGKIIACSQEKVNMPQNLLGFVQTKGSIARGFLFAHICDSQIDPGYRGNITLELLNMSDFYYKLIPGMPIASLFFFTLNENVSSYNGRYQNSNGPTAMKSQ